MARAGAEGPASKALEAVERAKNAPFRPAQDNLAAARGLISVSLGKNPGVKPGFVKKATAVCGLACSVADRANGQD